MLSANLDLTKLDIFQKINYLWVTSQKKDEFKSSERSDSFLCDLLNSMEEGFELKRNQSIDNHDFAGRYLSQLPQLAIAMAKHKIRIAQHPKFWYWFDIIAEVNIKSLDLIALNAVTFTYYQQFKMDPSSLKEENIQMLDSHFNLLKSVKPDLDFRTKNLEYCLDQMLE